MVSLNTAMAIDLTGQVAADALPYNNYTGINGLLDFTRGAAMSENGKSILMMTSTSDHGRQSRIVPSLSDIPVVVPRGDVQFIATEYGVVNLFGKTLQERAMDLISLARRDVRDELLSKAKELDLIDVERKFKQAIKVVYPVKYEEVIEMGFDQYSFLMENMNHAKARKKLEDLELFIYPHTKDENRSKIHKKLHKQATPQVEQAKRAITTDDLKGFGVSIEEIAKAKNGKRKANS